MVTVIRSAEIQTGKYLEAMAWAVQIGIYATSKFGFNTQVARNVGGMLSEVHWITTYENLGEFEKSRGKLETDEVYIKMLGEAIAKDFFVSETITDKIYSAIPLQK